eukprot:scpid104230/ scgid25427/ 
MREVSKVFKSPDTKTECMLDIIIIHTKSIFVQQPSIGIMFLLVFSVFLIIVLACFLWKGNGNMVRRILQSAPNASRGTERAGFLSSTTAVLSAQELRYARIKFFTQQQLGRMHARLASLRAQQHADTEAGGHGSAPD